ncbi:MAG: DegV family protein [Oscillospiraceae bacterium]|nr:DegV family protein [Oscillospiraceae bacterium]
MKIAITSDSTCDLSKELIEKYDIKIIPLYINKGSESLRDGLEITPNDIFEYVDSGAGVCQTSALNMVDYTELFEERLQSYDAVIHFNISSGFSSCHANARLAAEELENVYVIDTLNLSTGSGHLVLDAAIMAQEGKTPEEIVAVINGEIPKVESSFVIDTLKYLHKGGRCSALTALGANLLKLKPCIEVKDGKMDVGKKYRGNFKTVILQYVRDRLVGREDIDSRRIFITYAIGTPEEVVDAVEAEVRACMEFDEVIRTKAGCTISNHCGPVCLGILFFRK